MSTWTEHVSRWKDCTNCPLCCQRDRICLARGTVPCEVLFVGEAPGASEDAIGQPFVGPAGRLLDQIIERALPKSATYALTNLVCCFPREAKAAGDNEPAVTEIRACRPRLEEFVNISQPRLIVCVGALAAEYVYRSRTLVNCDIVHPAAILRMPLAQKQMAVEKCIVQIRSAYGDVLESPFTPFEKWRGHASVTAFGSQVRVDYDQWATDKSIPF